MGQELQDLPRGGEARGFPRPLLRRPGPTADADKAAGTGRSPGRRRRRAARRRRRRARHDGPASRSLRRAARAARLRRGPRRRAPTAARPLLTRSCFRADDHDVPIGRCRAGGPPDDRYPGRQPCAQRERAQPRLCHENANHEVRRASGAPRRSGSRPRVRRSPLLSPTTHRRVEQRGHRGQACVRMYEPASARLPG